MSHSFWDTIEVVCWSKDLEYESYINSHTRFFKEGIVHGSPLSRQAYQRLREMLTQCMQEELNLG